MLFTDLIEKKKKGLALDTEEISFWIKGYVDGTIPDYQVSALLMAIIFQGMDDRETLDLTMAMMHSGDVMDLSAIEGIKADKHSTGGVGDKTSLVLGPMTAACGVRLAKMSGRGLGFTGGTLDKLESIPGFQVGLAPEDFVRQVNELGIAIIGQTGNLVPADKKMYALRDVTGTVNSIPLIASSIMSKKLAAGSDVIVLDVKYGQGAFMKTVEDARKLAEAMIRIGRGAGRRVRAMISSMEAPLGCAIGNALEVQEAVMTLMGQGPQDLVELCVTAGSLILTEAGAAEDMAVAKEMLEKAVADGSALQKLEEMVKAQGGDVSVIRHPEKLENAPCKTVVASDRNGFINGADALVLGRLAMQIGAGRATKEDDIWHDVGLVLNAKPGDHVEKGDPLVTVHHRQALTDDWMQALKGAFRIDPEAGALPPLIMDIL